MALSETRINLPNTVSVRCRDWLSFAEHTARFHRKHRLIRRLRMNLNTDIAPIYVSWPAPSWSACLLSSSGCGIGSDFDLANCRGWRRLHPGDDNYLGVFTDEFMRLVPSCLDGAAPVLSNLRDCALNSSAWPNTCRIGAVASASWLLSQRACGSKRAAKD